MRITKALRSLAIIPAMMLIAVAAAYSGEALNESRAVNSNAVIRINLLAGELTITSWDRDEVIVTGTLAPGVKAFKISGSRKDMEFKVEYPRKKRNFTKSTLDFKIPRDCRLSLESVSTDVKIAELNGPIEIESVSGNIDLDCASRDIEIESVSGDIVIRGAREHLGISIISGEVDIIADALSEFDFSAVSGSLRLRADATNNGDWIISCHSGDVNLRLPADISAEFEIDTFSGDIDNGFGQKARRTSKFTPGKELFFKNGTGESRIEISVFSGDIRLEKQ